MFTSQLSLMLYGPIVKVPRGLFPSHAEWTFCQNVPATVAPAAYKVEGPYVPTTITQKNRTNPRIPSSQNITFSKCARFPLSPRIETVEN